MEVEGTPREVWCMCGRKEKMCTCLCSLLRSFQFRCCFLFVSFGFFFCHRTHTPKENKITNRLRKGCPLSFTPNSKKKKIKTEDRSQYKQTKAKMSTMDKYVRVDRPRVETPILPNEVRITSSGKMRHYISYATSLFEEVSPRFSFVC